MRNLTDSQKAYIAGFLDADGSIYAQAKINKTHKYGYQIAPYIVFYQSKKSRENFKQFCELINLGYIRERKDGILEYIIGRINNIQIFLEEIGSYVLFKREQVRLLTQIIETKKSVKSKQDFRKLLELVDKFRELNYSKRRKVRTLTP